MKIIFATHNQNKVGELNQLVPSKYSLLSLNDIGSKVEIEETGNTLEENAQIKADYVRFKYGLDCFSDDSGNPKANFRSVFYIHFNKKTFIFQGKVEGNLIYEKRGLGGFGYDPIFIPKGYDQTFSELGNEIKNKISHRALATKQFLKLLQGA